MGRWERRYYRVLNAVMRILLRSPLHRLRSHRVLLLEFHGRRTGRRYRMPVSFWEREPGQVICLSSATWSRWWKNLDGAELVIWLSGRERAAHAELVSDGAPRRELVSGFLRHNPHDAHHYGVETDGDIVALADSGDTKVISIETR